MQTMERTRSGLWMPESEARPYRHPLQLVREMQERVDAGEKIIGGGARIYYRQYQEPAGHTLIADNDGGSAITGTSEALLWPYQFTGIPPQALVPGQQINIQAYGVMTTASSSPGTMTINPRWGTTTSGVTLGISNTSPTLPTSLSAVPWFLQFTATLRVSSITATSSTVKGAGIFVSTGIGSATVPGVLVMGGAAATVDTVSTESLVFGVILGSASDTMTVQGISLEVLN